MIIDIDEDMTFGEGDDGIFYRATDACCFIIPLDSTWNFQLEDRLYIMKKTSQPVEIVGEESEGDSVTINATGTKINKQNSGALFVKVGENEWDEMFGNLI